MRENFNYRSNLKFLVKYVNSYNNVDQRYYDLWSMQLNKEITKIYLQQALMPSAPPASEDQIAKSQILKQQIVNLCINWDRTQAREKVLLEAYNHSQATPVEVFDAKIQALSDYQYAERDRLYAEQTQLIQSYEKAHL